MMRAPWVLVVVTAVGCAGSARPAVIPTMTQMPAESEKRDHLLDSAGARPTAESRKSQTPKERKAETAAATAAAVVGWLMSSSENVVLGASAPIDENRLFEDHQARPVPGPAPTEHDATPSDRPAVLIPWIDLGPKR
ncbi:MAG: hypothetical protein WKG01_02040 [Kofleriaceae bacterium]